MFTGHVFLLICLSALTNAVYLVDLLSKLRRGNPFGPSNVYDWSPSSNTVKFELPVGNRYAAMQSHQIQQAPASESKSNFHSLLRQFGASIGAGRDVKTHTNTGHNALTRQQYTPAYQGPNRRQYTPAQQVPNRRQYTPAQQVPNRQQMLPTQQVHRGGWVTPNQNSPVRQQYQQGYTRVPVPNHSRAQVPRTTGFTREQLPVSNHGRAQVSRQTGFTRKQAPVPNQSRAQVPRQTGFVRTQLPVSNNGRAQIPRTTGFVQKQLPVSNQGRAQVSRQTGFTRKHIPTSNQAGVQQFAQKNGFAQKHIPKPNYGMIQQFARVKKTQTPVSSGTSFGQLATKPRYSIPDIRPRRF